MIAARFSSCDNCGRATSHPDDMLCALCKPYRYRPSRVDGALMCENPPPRDWLVLELTDHGPGSYYRYTTRGVNLNYHPDNLDYRFTWRVRELCDRYDLSQIGGAK